MVRPIALPVCSGSSTTSQRRPPGREVESHTGALPLMPPYSQLVDDDAGEEMPPESAPAISSGSHSLSALAKLSTMIARAFSKSDTFDDDEVTRRLSLA